MPRKMSRTTIMAPDDLLDRLRVIAKEEGTSLGEVIREGLQWRASLRRRPPSFVGAFSSGDGPHNTAERSEEIILEMARDGRL